MVKIRLHDEEVPLLGTNMHLHGHSHPRFDFVKENYKPFRVLDVGCGEGVFARYCAEELNCIVVAMDIIQPKKEIPGVLFLRLDAKHMSATDCYNTVILMEMIEHFEDPREIIDKCYNALLPGGRVLITTPWVDEWDHLVDHVWRFDLKGVMELCEELPITTWMDNKFVYAVIEKPDESAD